MNPTTVKKLALSFSLLSFGILLFGSLLYGSRIVPAFIRGIEGGVLFGLLVWGLGSMLVDKPGSPAIHGPEGENTTVHLDETV